MTATDPTIAPDVTDHDFLPVAGVPDDDECTYRNDGTDLTYCGLPRSDHAVTATDPTTDQPATPGEAQQAARWLLDAVTAFVLAPAPDDTDEDHDARYRAMCSAADDLRAELDAAPAADSDVTDCPACCAMVERWHRKAAAEGRNASDPPPIVQRARCRECRGRPLSSVPPAGTEADPYVEQARRLLAEHPFTGDATPPHEPYRLPAGTEGDHG